MGSIEPGKPPRVSEDEVYRALSRVYDPELDEPITSLGFVKSIRLGEHVEVEITTSTYWCSPSFVYMMLEDARREIAGSLGLGLERVRVYIRGHHDEERINGCINRGRAFEECYSSEASKGLRELARVFEGKRLLRRLYRFARVLVGRGLSPEEILSLDRGSIRDLGSYIAVKAGEKEVVITDPEEVRAVRDYLSFASKHAAPGEGLIAWIGGGRPSPEDLKGLIDGRGRSLDLMFTLNSEICRLLLSSRLSRGA